MQKHILHPTTDRLKQLIVSEPGNWDCLPTTMQFIMAMLGIMMREMSECLPCRRQGQKFNRRQILNHDNAKHSNKIPTQNPYWTRLTYSKGDPVLQMERDYGRRRPTYGYNEEIDDFDRVLYCARCAARNLKKGGIKQHLAKHNELGRWGDFSCPYFPSTFPALAITKYPHLP